jgi:hypothetical protein
LSYQIWNLLAHKASERGIRVFFAIIDNGPNVPGGAIKNEDTPFELREMNGDFPYSGKSPGVLFVVNHVYRYTREFDTIDHSLPDEKIVKKSVSRTINVNEDVGIGSQIKTIVAAKFICEHFDFEWIIRTNMSSFWNWGLLINKLDTIAEKCFNADFGDDGYATNTSSWPAAATGNYISFSGGFFSGAGMYFTRRGIQSVIDRYYPGPLIEDVWFQSFYKDITFLNFSDTAISEKYKISPTFLNFFNATDETTEYNPDLIGPDQIALVHHYRIRCPDNSHEARVKHDIPYFKQLVKQVYGFDLHMD